LYAVIAIMTIPNVLVNPITKGLSAVREKPIIQMTKEIHDKDPSARWIVYDKEGIEGPRLANLLESNGINTFNGVKFVPPLKDMAVLDPEKKRDSAYNRYAWISMQTFINWKDSIQFDQHYYDAYTIFMDPCSPRLKTLGVKYVVFRYKPEDAEVRCMTKAGEANGIFIYKRKDE